MHAGLARARGERIVTMDGDLQNAPEDIPKLVAALDRADVASGRRVGRRDSVGRTLPSRLVNGMLRRFTGVAVSDFGCAFNAYRRERDRAGARLDRQAEVHEGARSVDGRERRGGRRLARAGGRRVSLLADPARPARAPRPRRILAAAGPVDRRRPRARLRLRGDCARHLRRRLLDRERRLPRAALRRSRHHLRPRRAGVHPRADRRVPGQDPARRGGKTAVHDRPRSCD